MSSPEFEESSGKMLETMLAAQKSVRDNMRTYLETMNVPTREDIARLGELVVGLEEKIDQVVDRLDTIEDAIRAVPAGATGPAGPRGAAGPAGPRDALERPDVPAPPDELERSDAPAPSGVVDRPALPAARNGEASHLDEAAASAKAAEPVTAAKPVTATKPTTSAKPGRPPSP